MSSEAPSADVSTLDADDSGIRSSTASLVSLVKKIMAALIVGALVFAGARYGVRVLSHSFAVETTDDAYTDSHIVAVSPKIAGRVKEVFVEENQQVKKGEKLVDLDPVDLDLKMAAKKAALTSAQSTKETAMKAMAVVQARLDSANAAYQKSLADTEAARATANRAESEYKRVKNLANTHAVSVQDVETTEAASIEAREHLKAAEQGIATARSGMVEAEALVQVAKTFIEGNDSRVHEAEVALKETEQDVSYTRIVAPEDGRVTRKSVEPGAYLQPGQNVMALVPKEMWISANFKETQLDNIHEDHHDGRAQKVEIRLDAYPNLILRGHVDSVQAGSGARFSLFPPENASGNFVKVVQRVPVKIVFDDKLPSEVVPGPGLSVVPDVMVGRELLDERAQLAVAAGLAALVFILVVRRRAKAPDQKAAH